MPKVTSLPRLLPTYTCCGLRTADGCLTQPKPNLLTEATTLPWLLPITYCVLPTVPCPLRAVDGCLTKLKPIPLSCTTPAHLCRLKPTPNKSMPQPRGLLLESSTTLFLLRWWRRRLPPRRPRCVRRCSCTCTCMYPWWLALHSVDIHYHPTSPLPHQ